MTDAAKLVELVRGDLVESVHRGHVVICDTSGDILAAWGDPKAVIYPRSSCKMLQALPLVESGAAAQAGLGVNHLAFACASHKAAAIHTDLATSWLESLGLSADDLRCGPQIPQDIAARGLLREEFGQPCQIHNNCSGKHCGFVTLNQTLKGGSEYTEVDHPVQKAVREAFEEMTGATSPAWGIDGCSAPNFACEIGNLARAMAKMAHPTGLGATRKAAIESLIPAMMAYPELVDGFGTATTEFMQAANGKAAIKTGAEGVYVAILPERGIGIALKIEDGAGRASEAAMAAILVRLGVVDAADPRIDARLNRKQLNRRGINAAHFQVTDDLYRGGSSL
ncbi:MAG: asparaginase [Rhodobacteraceae bacterium]|nr:asparaginase [Paracoccaceae bacterium]